MSRSHTRHQPPSPPMSNNGDFGVHLDGGAHLNPYTPPRSAGPLPYEHSSEHLETSYPVHTLGPQPSRHSPQVTFTRNINNRSMPIAAKHDTTYNESGFSPPAEHPTAQRPKRGGGLTKKRSAEVLPGPLSEITQAYNVPIRDMEAWVNRSVEQRLREVEAKHGHVARPMNSFMLYRSAYAERVKQYCRENNHQVVSKVTGQSWPIETQQVRDLYTRLALEEKDHHQAAHPGYKFTPNKSGKKRARDEESEDDSDVECRAPRQTKRSRTTRGQGRRNAPPSPSPLPHEAGSFTVMRPSSRPSRPHPSSYRALNPQAPQYHTFGDSLTHNVYQDLPALPFHFPAEDVRYQTNPRYMTDETDCGLTGMPDGSDSLLIDSSYPPLYSLPEEQLIDPSLGQPDGSYKYGHPEVGQETYIVPRSVPHGSFGPSPTLYYQDHIHPGMTMLPGNMDAWYNSQEPDYGIDGDFAGF